MKVRLEARRSRLFAATVGANANPRLPPSVQGITISAPLPPYFPPLSPPLSFYFSTTLISSKNNSSFTTTTILATILPPLSFYLTCALVSSRIKKSFTVITNPPSSPAVSPRLPMLTQAEGYHTCHHHHHLPSTIYCLPQKVASPLRSPSQGLTTLLPMPAYLPLNHY